MDSRSQLFVAVTSLIDIHQMHLNRRIRENEERTFKLIRRRRMQITESWKSACSMLQESIRLFGVIGVYRSLVSLQVRIRCIGSKYRVRVWFQHVSETFDEEQWLENFRMRRKTFFDLVEILREELEESPNCPFPGLTVEEKVAIGVYRLASLCEYRTVGNIFGTHKSTNCEWLHTFVRAVNTIMLREYLRFTTSKEECGAIATEFEARYGIPQVVGAIDGSYIAVTAPANGSADFRCRKGHAAVILQAVVDNRRQFRDVTIKHPGNNHDATVLVDSYLYQNIERLMPQSDRVYANNSMPFVILGDPAYPLLPWLMKDYRVEQTPEQTSFNIRMNAARCVVEQAFGRLKLRWRILSRRNDLDIYFVPEVVLTCCILHNFVERAKEPFRGRWTRSTRNEQPLPPQFAENYFRDRRNGIVVRDTIAAYMAANFPLLHRS